MLTMMVCVHGFFFSFLIVTLIFGCVYELYWNLIFQVLDSVQSQTRCPCSTGKSQFCFSFLCIWRLFLYTMIFLNFFFPHVSSLGLATSLGGPWWSFPWRWAWTLGLLYLSLLLATKNWMPSYHEVLYLLFNQMGLSTLWYLFKNY